MLYLKQKKPDLLITNILPFSSLNRAIPHLFQNNDYVFCKI